MISAGRLDYRRYQTDSTAFRKVVSIDLLSSRSKAFVSGSVNLKIGLVSHPDNPQVNLQATYADILKRAKAAEPSIMSAPPVRDNSARYRR